MIKNLFRLFYKFIFYFCNEITFQLFEINKFYQKKKILIKYFH